MNEKNIIETSFEAKDLELKGWEYTIPEDMEAVIENRKVIVRKKESEDERIRKAIISLIREIKSQPLKKLEPYDDYIAWLEKQKEQTSVTSIQEAYREGFNNGIEVVKQKPEKFGLQKEHKPVISDEVIRDGVIHFGITQYQIDNWLKKHINVIEQKPVEIHIDNPNIQKLDPNVVVETRTDGTSSNVVNESLTYQPVEKRDYSGLSDLEQAILRGFLCAGIENVPVGIIKETANDCLAHLHAEWSEEYREEDIQTRFAFYTYKDDPSVLYLSNVFVEEASRNHGFGTRILKAAEKVAETIGAITICLKVKQDSPANAWYRKNGYGYVAFENGYDWLEKNLEYMKPNKLMEWSEEDEERLEKLHRLIILCREDMKYIKSEEYDCLDSWLKSLRPQQRQEQMALRWESGHPESYKSVLILRNGNVVVEGEWDEKTERWYQYGFQCHLKDNEVKGWMNKESLLPGTSDFRHYWKPSEEQMEALADALSLPKNCGEESSFDLRTLYEQLKKL